MAHYQLRRLDGEGQTFLLPTVGWLARVTGKMLTDSVRVVTALASSVAMRPARGRLSTIPFNPGESDARSVVRRAWITLGKSLTPNSIVIAVDWPHERLLVHELVSSGKPDVIQKWPA